MCMNGIKMSKSGVRKYGSVLRGSSVGDSYNADFYSRCGYCPVCVQRTQTEWLVRCWYQNYELPATYFVTLTYNDVTNNIRQGLICYPDVQDFIKSLRNYLDRIGVKFKYFVSCEYGKISHRPNYHIIFFSEQFLNDLHYIKRGKEGSSDVYVSDLINCFWNHGFATVQLITHDFAKVAKYMVKFDVVKENRASSYKRMVAKVYSAVNNQYAKVSLEDEEKLAKVKERIKEVKERRFASKEFGFYTFYDMFDEYVKNDGVYICGIKYRIPFSWLDKLAEEGDDRHREWCRKEYLKIIEDDKTVAERLKEQKEKGQELLAERAKVERTRFHSEDDVYI